MAVVKPFRALRYDPSRVDLAAVVAPPAERLDDAARDALYQADPRNIVRVTKGRREPQDRPGAVDRRAAFFLAEWQRAGVMRRDEEPAFYVLRATLPSQDGDEPQVLQGFFGAVELSPSDPWVRRHERVRPEVVEAIARQIEHSGVQAEPIFLLHRDEEGRVARAFEPELEREADVRFEHEDIVYELWVIDDETTTARVTQLFAQAPLYLADGHHRYEAALAFSARVAERAPVAELLEPASRFALAYFVPTSAEVLALLPQHRRVTPPEGFDAGAFVDALSRLFSVRPLDEQEAPKAALASADPDAVAFVVHVPAHGRFFVARAWEGSEKLGLGPEDARADVTVIQRAVVERLLGIQGEDLKRRVEVTPALGLAEGDDRLHFLLRPLSLTRLLEIADAGEVLPEKSTCFGPKPPSGLVVSPLFTELRA